LGQPQRRELADGLLFPAQAVLTRFDPPHIDGLQRTRTRD
jgi:hypothetical protein